MPELSTIYDYMRANAALLGARILEEYPALHQFDDAVSPRIEGLLRRPFPAQAIAIMGLAKRWQMARTAMVVAECGTGKTLISLGGIHVHSNGEPFTALAMVPPHLVEKWARESDPSFVPLPMKPGRLEFALQCRRYVPRSFARMASSCLPISRVIEMCRGRFARSLSVIPI